MKTKNLILFASLVLLNVQVYAQTFLNRNGKLTSDAAEAVSVNGAIGAANGIGRDEISGLVAHGYEYYRQNLDG